MRSPGAERFFFAEAETGAGAGAGAGEGACAPVNESAEAGVSAEKSAGARIVKGMRNFGQIFGWMRTSRTKSRSRRSQAQVKVQLNMQVHVQTQAQAQAK